MCLKTYTSPSGHGTACKGDMMPNLAFVPIDEPGLQLLQPWFEDDEL